MTENDLLRRAGLFPTPLIADACMRLGRTCRFAPGVQSLFPDTPVAGRVLPVRHHGSVDVFLEACGRARAGEVLVVDNGGRADEGCIGDLTALEARAAGLAGLVVWGAVRDVPELLRVGLPVFCTGRCPLGPAGVRPAEPGQPVRIAGTLVTDRDVVAADDDGVLFLALVDLADVLEEAGRLHRREREQADRLRAGQTLREQLRFADFLRERERDPGYTLRRHLERLGGAIEV